jgi:hypothetical protein
MQEDSESQEPKEPSVLDYVRSRLRFWEKDRLSLDFPDDAALTPEVEPAEPEETITKIADSARMPINVPWLVVIALLLALLAQILLEPSANRVALPGALFYLLAVVILILASARKQMTIPLIKEPVTSSGANGMRYDLLIAALILSAIAFILFGQGLFNFLNILLWLSAIVLVCLAFWERDGSLEKRGQVALEWIKRGQWQLVFTPWRVLVLLVGAVVIFMRFYQLNAVPAEMISDQAERVLSVFSILKGEFPLFFPRSTISEPLPFYWSALISKLFGLGGSFLGLKLASAIAGLVMLVYVYKLGKLLGGRWTGLFALVFAGIGFWPNLQARAALGGIYFPLFLSASLYHLVKGLRESRRNDLVLAGLFTGLGLLSSREFLVVPLLNLVIVGIYALHHKISGKRGEVLWAILILLTIGIVCFTPILRVMLNDSESYMFRIFSRLSDWERPLPGSGFVIFFKNLWSGLTMPFWSNASSWVDAVNRRPALDLISAALFMIGLVSLLIRYLQKRDWIDITLLVSLPVLLLPSVLSLAFPEENPSLSKAAGSMLPIFLMVGFGMVVLLQSVRRALPGKRGILTASLVAILLTFPSIKQNYRLVFKDYQTNYLNSALNATEMAGVIRQFGDTIGSYERVWVIGYPHWVDSRALALEAGLPGQDLALPLEQVELTQLLSGSKIFLLHPDDEEGRAELLRIYPEGILSEYTSKLENKHFMIFLVPFAGEGEF